MNKILFFILIFVMGLFSLTDLTEIKQQGIKDFKLKAPNLKAYIFCLPGNGCCWDSSSEIDHVLTAFCDPDIFVKNEGNAPSTGGKAKVEFFNLLTCSNLTAEVNIPPLNPGQWEAVTTGHTHYIAKKSEGIRLTLTYTDINGRNYTYSRVVRNCPDRY